MPPGQRQPWTAPVWVAVVLCALFITLGVLGALDGNLLRVLTNSGFTVLSLLSLNRSLQARRTQRSRPARTEPGD